MFRSHWTITKEHVDPSQSYHWSLNFMLHFGAAEACLYEVLGYVCIKTLKIIIPTCFGPTGPSSGSTSILAKVSTDR